MKSPSNRAVQQENPAFRALALLALSAWVLSGCQTTGDATLSRVAVSELPLRLGHFAQLNPDCSQIGELVVRVAKPPDHGMVAVSSGDSYTNFAKEDLRNACNYRPTRGVNVTYTSERSYTGPDTTVLDVIYPAGLEGRYSYSLNVK